MTRDETNQQKVAYKYEYKQRAAP